MLLVAEEQEGAVPLLHRRSGVPGSCLTRVRGLARLGSQRCLGASAKSVVL